MINQKIALVMGSQRDWMTLRFGAEILSEFGISYHVEIISAHRTPDQLFAFASQAKTRGFQVIIAGAGGAAHLPGMLAAKTILPVLGVPIESEILKGIDSLYSIVQMPKGVPVGTLAIGKAGAVNAALLAIEILALHDMEIEQRLASWRQRLTQDVLDNADPRVHEIPGVRE